MRKKLLVLNANKLKLIIKKKKLNCAFLWTQTWLNLDLGLDLFVVRLIFFHA